MGNLSMHALCGLLLVSLYLQHLPIVSTQGPPGSPARRGPPRSTTTAPPGGTRSGPESRTRDDQFGDVDHQRSEEHGESPGYQPGSRPVGDPQFGQRRGQGDEDPGMRPPPIAGAPGPIYGGQNDRHRPMNQPDAPECERKEKEQHSERSFRNEGRRQAPERRMRRPMHWPMRGIYGSQWQYEMSRDYLDKWNYDREYYGWQSQMQNRDEVEDEDCEDEEFERDIYSDGDRYDYPMDDCDGNDDGECMHRPSRRMGMDGYFDDMDYYYYTMYKYYNMGFGPYSLMTPPYLCRCMWQRPMMPPHHPPPRRRRSSRPPSRDCSTPATQSPPHTWHSPLLCDVRSLDTGNVLINVTCNDGFVCVNTNQTECSNVTISICIHENCTGMSYHDSKVCTMRKVKEDASKNAEGKENDDMRRTSGQRDGRGGRQCCNRYKGGQRGYGSGRESGRGGKGGNDEGESHGGGERGRQESSDNDRMGDGEGEQANSKLGDDMEKKYLKCLGLI